MLVFLKMPFHVLRLRFKSIASQAILIVESWVSVFLKDALAHIFTLNYFASVLTGYRRH